MATITIRNLADRTQQALKKRAARNGRSMEAEAREIIGSALSDPKPKTTAKQLSPEAEAALARLQKAFAPKPGEAPYTSDDFIKDRRADWGEA